MKTELSSFPGEQALTGFVAPDQEEIDVLKGVLEEELGPRYEFRGYLGRGAFATVCRVYDRVNRDVLAVKRFAYQPHQSKGFFRELSLLFRLRHERIVRVVNFLESRRGSRYLILEYCEGGTLRRALGAARLKGTPCPTARARELSLQLAQALHAAHQVGVVHRDVKPENILFAELQREPFGGTSPVKLADFGLACLLGQPGPTQPDGLARLSGTPAYMAPEQFTGDFGPSSDFYALGVILYELLHGHRPFEGSPENLAYLHLRETPRIDRGLPAPWPTWLAGLLHKEPARRLAGEEWIAALTRDSSGRGPGMPAAYKAPPGREPEAAKRPTSLTAVQRTATTAVELLAQPGRRGESALVVLCPKHLEWWDVGAGGRQQFRKIAGVTLAQASAEGTLWFVQGDRVWRQDPGEGSKPWLDLPGVPEALVVDRTPATGDRLVVALPGQVLEYAGRGERSPAWSYALRPNGIRPALARLADGRVAIAEGNSRPRLTALDARGLPETTWCLPGLCWDLLAWPRAGLLAARLLVGNSFLGYRLNLAGQRWEPLEQGQGLAFLTVARGGDGQLLGLRENGEVVAWTPQGAFTKVCQFDPPKTGFRAFAAGGTWCAVVGRDSAKHWLQVKPWGGVT